MIVTAGAVAVFRLPLPQVTESAEPEAEAVPDSEASPDPLVMDVRPAKVVQGSEITVSAECRQGMATVVSQALSYSISLGESGRLATGTIELDSSVPPGVYEVRAKCAVDGRTGRATFEVVPPKGGIPPARGLSAVTRVTVTTLSRGAVQEEFRARSEEPESDINVRIAVTHEWRLRADDPDVTLLRTGAALTEPTDFVAERLGEVDPFSDGAYYPIEFDMPVLRSDPDSGQVVVTATGVGYSESGWEGDRIFRLTFWPPTPDGEVSRPATHDVTVTAPGLTLTGVTGVTPTALDRESLRFDGTRIARAVFGDGPSSSGYLAAAYLAGDLLGDVITDPDRPDLYASSLPWPVDAATGLLSFLALLIVAWTFARSLGAAWWRRWDNRFLMIWAVVLYAVLLQIWDLSLESVLFLSLLLLGCLPALVLTMAARRIGPPPWPGSTFTLLSIAAGLAGAVLTGSGLLLVTPVPWWVAVVLAVAAGATALRRLRPYAPAVAAVSLGAGVLLTARAAQGGLAPGYVALAMLAGLEVVVLVFGGLSVATGRWSTRTLLWSAAALIPLLGVSLTGVRSTFSPDRTTSEQLPSLLEWYVSSVLLLHFALLVVMLVLRLRRLGQVPAAVFLGEAYATMTLALFLSQVTPGFASDLTIVIMWGAVLWLLSGSSSRRAKNEPDITPEQHRSLVRALVGRRFARLALTDLLRQGRSRIATGEMSLAVFEKQRRTLLRASDDVTGPIDSDLALATAAGRTPWEAAVIAFGTGLVLSVPFTTARAIQTNSGEELLSVLATAAIAPLMCAIFGFFYPRVRGDQPLSKSLFLLLAAVVVTLPTHLYSLVITLTADPAAFSTPLPTPVEVVIGALLSMGNLAVVCLGLGLFWEWRLLRLADEPWGRVRSVRSARAVAAPLTAVVIAAGTAVTTALVNNAIAPLPTISETAQPTRQP
ncbi:hypothetical protein [Acrocarpospora phusangensis]|nr:hypothetical protein [Acrocarpospora phusangensis]